MRQGNDRYAAIDVGTNTVLLLIAERDAHGTWVSVKERAEITRLGQGVDASRALHPDAMARTLETLHRYAVDLNAYDVRGVVASATSAARDASNGPHFVAEVKARTGISLEVLSGDEEARLSFASAHADFGGAWGLAVLDIGGGSTELMVGDAMGVVRFRRSFDIGAVRLTERNRERLAVLGEDEPASREVLLAALVETARSTFVECAPLGSGVRLVGVAGTVTTAYAVVHGLEPYDGRQVHGATLTRAELDALTTRLAALPLADRKHVKGLEPKRADVIVAGLSILAGAMESLQVSSLTVSDRGLRWGLLADRFGRSPTA